MQMSLQCADQDEENTKKQAGPLTSLVSSRKLKVHFEPHVLATQHLMKGVVEHPMSVDALAAVFELCQLALRSPGCPKKSRFRFHSVQRQRLVRVLDSRKLEEPVGEWKGRLLWRHLWFGNVECTRWRLMRPDSQSYSQTLRTSHRPGRLSWRCLAAP